jgi:beta-glucosidase
MRRLSLAVLLLLAAGCAAQTDPGDTTEESSILEAAGPALSSFDPRVDELLPEMTLEEKIGQMTQPDMSYLVDEEDIATYFLGSVLSGGGSDPTPENTFEDWRAMYEGYQGIAQGTRLGIPLLYGVDAVHGHSNVVGAVVFPHNIGLGATRSAELVERVYRATALEVRATGINWNFAPCVAVARDIRWGRTYESFGESPELVAELGEAAVRGVQGSGLGDPTAVAGCAKHYVGDGGTVFGTGAPMDAVPASVFEEIGAPSGVERWPLDRGDVQLDEATLREVHMAGYPPAIAAGVATIMPSFNSWNGERLSGHRYLLTDVLKGELGFEGFLISDWAAIDDLPGDYRSDIEQAINAGMDMVMVPDRYREFFDTLKSLVEDGSVPMERIDDAVRRILRVKFAMGLMEPDAAVMADRSLESRFGAEEHRALAREAVRRSVVVLKADDGALPLAKTASRIHVAGKNADDIGNQSGGWTIQWQGSSGDITVGTTVLEAIREAASPETEVTYSLDGTGAEGADVAVVVVGERPYAEMMGDRFDLSLDPQDRAAIETATAEGVPVVVVLISGRPLILGDALDQAVAVVAAWLPGSEGQGLTDILFGDHPATGRLPFTWPRDGDSLQLDPGDSDYDPLFAFGYGLDLDGQPLS